MKLQTYRIDFKTQILYLRRSLFYNLYEEVLIKDKYWHWFNDFNGATLRVSLLFRDRVEKWLKNHEGNIFTFKRRTQYIPQKHEYYGVAFVGDDLLPMFHELSVLTAKFPSNIVRSVFLERLNHLILVNIGYLGHAFESEVYLDLAFSRAKIVNHTFILPRWVYKIAIKLQSAFKLIWKTT